MDSEQPSSYSPEKSSQETELPIKTEGSWELPEFVLTGPSPEPPDELTAKPELSYDQYHWQESKGTPRYLIEGSPLAEGAFSEVYKAYDRKLEIPVAFKFLKTSAISEGQLKDLLEIEAKTMARLEHPGVVRTYAFFKPKVDQEGVPHSLREIGDQIPVIVMEFCDPKKAPTLRDKLEKGALSLQEISKIVRELAKTIDDMAKKGLIHNDLKPGNIFLDSNYTKISDFGISSWFIDKLRQNADEGTILGTPYYLSPEAAVGEPTDLKSEVFCLGNISWEMLTGEKLFKGKNPLLIIEAILEKQYPGLKGKLKPEKAQQLGIDTIEKIDRILGKALEKEANQRYKTASQFAQEFCQTIEGLKFKEEVVNQPSEKPDRIASQEETQKLIRQPA